MAMSLIEKAIKQDDPKQWLDSLSDEEKEQLQEELTVISQSILNSWENLCKGLLEVFNNIITPAFQEFADLMLEVASEIAEEEDN